MKKESKKILVGMSGGVDSAVAVLLLQKESYQVEGLFIDFIGGDKSEKDFKKAQKVAHKLNVPIYKLDAQKIFKEKIIDKFVADYDAGITPNPCVACNPEMKFRILIEEANNRGINKVATGHYARVEKFLVYSPQFTEGEISNFKFQISNKIQNPNVVQGSQFAVQSKKNTQLNSENQEPITNNYPLPATSYQLTAARDSSKDQSYFLYRLNQEQLAKTIFPLGDYLKSEVREMAIEAGLEIKNEKESQDICFITNNDFNKFIADKIKNKPGNIVDIEGRILGVHSGLHFYTIGQRKGINLGGDGPYYVTRKDKTKNELVVTNNIEDNSLVRDSFQIKNTNWILKDLRFPLRAKVRSRYHSQLEYAIIDKEDGDIYKVILDKKQKAITSGQSAVFYLDPDVVLGGGIII